VDLGVGRQRNVVLHAAPTSVADSVGTRLFREDSTVILTSGTLSVNGSLSYMQTRLGAATAESLVLDSPFDFRKQMQLVLVRDIPSPDQEGYENALPEAVVRSVLRSGGRALVLFTNASLMKRTGEKVRGWLEEEGITLLIQDGTMGRHQLLENFKADVRSVLFGLDSFWMGVDVQGEALEHVIITRLPFAVPDHPLIESRMELITKKGGSAFQEYTLPEAVLKFKQGVGRLIRSGTDKGLVTVLDSRVITKQYGRVFLQSLPRCPVEIITGDGSVVHVDEEGWESG
jgi:ATP-dependent DNA helicase DinG